MAFGRLDTPPHLITMLLDPLVRDDPGLDLLGAVLHDYLRDPGGCQVWVPDEPSFTALAIEGLRSRTNPGRSPLRRQLGVCLHALAQLKPLPGQQVVAMATEVLAEHLVTGQSPINDTHLGARLAWDDPLPRSTPAYVATQRLHHPGPSLLTVAEDERVESLRARLRTGSSRQHDREEIRRSLTQAAEASWELLTQAWTVFRHLPLPPLAGLEQLEADSQKELDWLLGGTSPFTQHLGRACHEFAKREFWRARLEDLEARGDPITREVLRRKGRVISATTLRCHDRWLILAATQSVLRLRPGTRLSTGDGRISAVVATIHFQRGKTVLLVRVTRGIRAAAALPLGRSDDWFDSRVFGGRAMGRPGLTHLADIPPATALPPLAVPADLLAFARSLRQP